MALIKCKECGTEVAVSAKACPNCGNTRLSLEHTLKEMADKSFAAGRFFGGLAFFLVIVTIALFWLMR